MSKTEPERDLIRAAKRVAGRCAQQQAREAAIELLERLGVAVGADRLNDWFD